MLSAIIALFASCVGLNLSPLVNYQPSNAVISDNNYRIVGEVSGECSQQYIFGFGGMSDKSKESNAIKEMYKNANLKPGQAIININVTYTQQVYFLAIVIKVTSIAHGTIIEFTDGTPAPISTPSPIVDIPQSDAPKIPQKIDVSAADSIILTLLKQTPNKSIGDPELLRNYQTAQLKITGINIDPAYHDQFRKQFNYRIVHYGSFSLKESEQPLVAHLIVTNVEGDNISAVIRFATIEGKDLTAFSLGTGTIKSLAHTLADRLQYIVKSRYI